MIILDYSQVALASVLQFQSELQKGSSNPEAVNIIRHAVLTGVKGYKKRYGPNYGQVVIACDGKNYWRKSLFPHYKAGRKATRDKSSLDWHMIFDTMSSIRDDITEHFPYKVLHFDHIEADDIIGVLCKWLQSNETVDHGVFEDLQPVMIVSSDGDFKQLHKYSNVEQWSPIQKKKVLCLDPAGYLAEHIAKAGDDGIPNVLSPDDVFVKEDLRQTPMRAKILKEFVAKGRKACTTDEQRAAWDRNNALINLDMIPEKIQEEIITAYLNNNPKGNKMAIYNYLVKHRCRLLLNEIEEF